MRPVRRLYPRCSICQPAAPPGIDAPKRSQRAAAQAAWAFANCLRDLARYGAGEVHARADTELRARARSDHATLARPLREALAAIAAVPELVSGTCLANRLASS